MPPIDTDTDTILICASFFGYAREIMRRLEAKGRRVAHFEDRPTTHNFSKGFLRVAPSAMRTMSNEYFRNIIRQVGLCPIKDVLVIKGEGLSTQAISEMRAAMPNARFTLYFWDSYLNMPSDSPRKVDLFDKAFTFDPRDAAKDKRLFYRPLFYVNEGVPPDGVQQDIDVLFFGTMHGDRHAVLKRIGRILPKGLRFEKYLYLPARWLYPIRTLRDPSMIFGKRGDFIYSPKQKSEIDALVTRSRIVIDIERPVQTGYTIRAVELLCFNRKLITTNSEMNNADFFNPGNIAVVDRKNPQIDPSFFGQPFTPLDNKVLSRYSLDSWIDEVLPDSTKVYVG